jgi:circadian clock protein KaiB
MTDESGRSWANLSEAQSWRSGHGAGARPDRDVNDTVKDRRRVGDVRFRLYIAGDTVASQKARENLQRLCEQHPLPIETIVVDVLNEPALADSARILATPTLVYEHQARSKRVVGDLSDIEKVIQFLGLQRGDDGHP